MKEIFKTIKQVLVPMFYKEAQLGRSLRKRNKIFNVESFKSIMYLVSKADNNTLKNIDIREKIKEVSKKAGVSIGQSQKVINVYLKYYCILTKKLTKIIKELDSPLDNQIMSKFKGANLRKVNLKDLNDFNNYIAWQDHLEKEGNGFRIKPDIDTYDKKRIKLFLS